MTTLHVCVLESVLYKYACCKILVECICHGYDDSHHSITEIQQLHLVGKILMSTATHFERHFCKILQKYTKYFLHPCSLYYRV